MSRDDVVEDASEDAEIIIEALEQVRDPEIEASKYSFLNELEKMHPASSKKGNDGLANWIAHLAVFEADDKVLIDEGLVEEADRILAEQHDNPRYGRSRIANIVYDSENRPGDKLSIAEKRFHGKEDNGHNLLVEMVADFYIETNQEKKLENLYKDSGLLLACDNMTEGGMSTKEFKESDHELVESKSYDGESFPPGVMVYEPKDNQNPESNNEGGDNDMGLVEDVSEYAQDRMDDGMDAADAYEDAIDHYSDDLNEADAKLQSVETALRQELLAVSIKGGEMQRVIGHLEGKIDAREDDREDTMDSIRASYNNITDR